MATQRPLVMVMNTDTAFLHLLEAILRDEGYEPVLLQTGDIAVESAAREQPKLIVLDIDNENPNISWRVADLLLLNPNTSAIPLIICSVADQILADRMERLRAVHVTVLEKPFDLNELMEATRAQLNAGTS